MTADGGVHGARIGAEPAVDHCLVRAKQGVVLELGGQGQMGPVVFRGDEQAGGVPVDAVDDSGAQFAVDAGEGGAAVIEQGVDQRAVGVAGGGVDHQTHRLIDHDHVAVLIDHVQRDVLGTDVHRHRLGPVQADLVAGGGLIVLFHRRAVDADPALLQQPLGG